MDIYFIAFTFFEEPKEINLQNCLLTRGENQETAKMWTRKQNAP